MIVLRARLGRIVAVGPVAREIARQVRDRRLRIRSYPIFRMDGDALGTRMLGSGSTLAYLDERNSFKTPYKFLTMKRPHGCFA